MALGNHYGLQLIELHSTIRLCCFLGQIMGSFDKVREYNVQKTKKRRNKLRPFCQKKKAKGANYIY